MPDLEWTAPAVVGLMALIDFISALRPITSVSNSSRRLRRKYKYGLLELLLGAREISTRPQVTAAQFVDQRHDADRHVPHERHLGLDESRGFPVGQKALDFGLRPPRGY